MKEVETDCGALLVSLEVSDLNPIFAFSYGKQSRGNPIDHAVMRCIKERAAKERQQRTVYPGNKRLEPSDESEGRLSKAYYCSDMELYTFQEPCTTCAMALLHSRIARVVYVNHQEQGALGSVYSLHTHAALNHHFEVFHCHWEENRDCTDKPTKLN